MIDKFNELVKWSNPSTAQAKAKKYMSLNLYISSHPEKKYMIYDGQKWIHFGQMGYEDFTKHKDLKRRENYLTRTSKMRGNWKSNPLSPNNLSRNILW
jgi:hypothetical protein